MGRPLRLTELLWGGGERVEAFDAVSILIFAGWLPQDGLFGCSGRAALAFERHLPLQDKVIAHSALAGHCQAAAVTTWSMFGHFGG